jgi:antitoxin component of RelBE/YafQ-DinJ toxin-antitoxin module
MSAAERRRQHLLNVRVNEDEKRMAQELADAEGLGMSDYVRNLIRREHALTFGRTRATKKRRKVR